MFTRRQELAHTVDRLIARSMLLGRRLIKNCECGCIGDPCRYCTSHRKVLQLATEGTHLRKLRSHSPAEVERFLREATLVLRSYR